MQMFKLSRYFSIASAIGIILVVTALSLFYRHFAVNALMAHETRASVAVTKVFANSVWPKYASFVKNAARIPKAELPQRKEIAELRADLLRHMKGLNIVKVKIYNLDGLTVFSTDPKQIGQDKSSNTGFLNARAGKAASEITYRHQFNAFEQVIVDRNLIETYIPIQEDETPAIKGVFEVYSDVTELVTHLEATQRQIVTVVLLALSLLYLFLFLIVKRADNIIKTQEKERRANEAEVRYQAYHDSLTGLPNRASFAERMQEALRRAKRARHLVGLLFLDLDRFKVINDSLGHSVGDGLLQLTAKRLQAHVRESDMAFRMGGDEFTVILENLRAPEDAALVAKRIIESMSQPVTLHEHGLTATISIGMAIGPRDATDAETLVKHADAAMYRAKQAGRNRYEFYTEDLNSKAIERFTLESGLRRALEEGEFMLYYQPKVSVTSGEIVGKEALIRWKHPELGILTPDKFLPVLEDTGLIIPVGEWVLRTACQQTKDWHNAGFRLVPVSVNISSRQFRTGSLLNTIRRVLSETGLEPGYLELELTERLLTDNAEEAIGVLNELKQMGVLISIDDFGTGYSSLNYLRRFPIDILKIDKSFVRDMVTHEKDAAIASAIISLARNLNLGLIAEGVEELNQVEFLQSRGCNEVQGYLFSRPLPPEEFRHLLSMGSLGDVVRGKSGKLTLAAE
jgi:diguanylate cyclase (GGDEF)-like protein